MPYYLNPLTAGILSADSNFNGTDITVRWSQAYPTVPTNLIAYNIFIDNGIEPAFNNFFFSQSPAFVSVGSATSAVITDLIPGQLYHFGVRAVEYNPVTFDLATLPDFANGLKLLPKSLLSSNITATDTTIPLVDTSEFPSTGVIKLGTELIKYTSIVGENLIVTAPIGQRGYNGTVPTIHNIDGYNGTLFWEPNAILWVFENEEQNTQVYECENRFDYPKFSYTNIDGYKNKTVDLLNTNLTVSDELNTGFPAYSFSGYHRVNPIDLLSGKCVGSYFGGEYGCYDGYNGVVPVRGLSVQDINLQRQEVLLSTTGEPVILMKRVWTGVVCSCYLPNQEYPEARCNLCLGTGQVVGWEQFFNPRRSDGKIMVRFDPTVEQVIEIESGAGLESELKPNCWTLTVPSLHERDFIVRFDQDGNQEYRYEIVNVTRNKFFLTFSGMQRFTAHRIRKTDILYQVPVLTQVNTQIDGEQGVNVLRTLTTSIASSQGFVPHIHTITVSQNIIDPSQINGITSMAQGHSHIVQSGIVTSGAEIPEREGIGHTHQLIFF